MSEDTLNAAALQRAVELGRSLAEPVVVNRKGGDQQKLCVVIPEGMKVAEIPQSEAEWPDRKRLSCLFVDVNAFIGYVNEQKQETTRVFSMVKSDGGASATAYIDFIGRPSDATSWVTHHARLDFVKTPEWERWLASNGKPMDQVEFAAILEDVLPEIIHPMGGQIMDIATSLQAKTSVDFKRGVRLQDGQTQIKYEETIEARAGVSGDLEIPDKITIIVEPFFGCSSRTIEARFRYRINQGKLVLWYQLIRPETFIREAVEAALTKISNEVELPVWMGSFSGVK